MKNHPPFSNNSRIALVFSLLVLFAGIYFGGSQMMMEDYAENQSNPTVISLSEGGPMNFVSPSDESSTNDTDLVARYSHLYGKYQVKINTKRNLSLPSDQEIEALRMEANQLNELYFKMSLEERKKIKRVSFPYAKLEVDGKVIYRRFEDLTQEERNSLNC
uniref:hypothetical protein n=1 Tax=Algoriphagus sp. TaxID=1872435 RepID=UPI004047CDC5